MFKQKIILLSISLAMLASCKKTENKLNSFSTSKEKSPTTLVKLSKADSLLNKTFNSHGGALYTKANYSFVFRGNTYQFKNNNDSYEYIKIRKKEESTIVDILKNGTFYRTVNEEKVTLNNKEISGASGAINSVIYFATLPHKLTDKSVNTTYVGETIIKDKNYHILSITFNKEGGGVDFEDEYYYWINSTTNKIDYLAYNYKVNNGGVRFRSAYNRRVIDGITFQDYINYKASLGTPLTNLPKLYETDQLKELSRIKTENIINLNNK